MVLRCINGQRNQERADELQGNHDNQKRKEEKVINKFRKGMYEA